MFAVGAGGILLNGLTRVEGNLIVNGTVIADKIATGAIITDKVATNAISNTAGVSSGGTTTSVWIYVRAGARVATQGLFNGLPGTYFPLGTPNNTVRIVRAGNIIAQTPTNFEASGTSTPAIAFTCTSVLAFEQPGEGWHEYFIQSTNGAGVGGVAILVTELAK